MTGNVSIAKQWNLESFISTTVSTITLPTSENLPIQPSITRLPECEPSSISPPETRSPPKHPPSKQRRLSMDTVSPGTGTRRARRVSIFRAGHSIVARTPRRRASCSSGWTVCWMQRRRPPPQWRVVNERHGHCLRPSSAHPPRAFHAKEPCVSLSILRRSTWTQFKYYLITSHLPQATPFSFPLAIRLSLPPPFEKLGNGSALPRLMDSVGTRGWRRRRICYAGGRGHPAEADMLKCAGDGSELAHRGCWGMCFP